MTPPPSGILAAHTFVPLDQHRAAIEQMKSEGTFLVGNDWWKGDKTAILGRAVIRQGEAFTVQTPAPETSTTASTNDDAIIAAAQALGSKATTVTGARKFLANLS